MMKKIRKPVSILLVFMMIVSLFTVVPISASAADYVDGSGISLDELAAGDTLSATYGNYFNLSGYGYSVIIKGDTYRERLGFEPQADDLEFQKGQVLMISITRDASGPKMIVMTADENQHEYYPLDAEGNISDKWYVLSNDTENRTVTLGGHAPASAEGGTIYNSGEHDVSELNTGDYIVSGIESLTDGYCEYTITLKAGTFADYSDGTSAYDADSTAESGMFMVVTNDGILCFQEWMEGYDFVPFVDDAIGNAFYVESADHDAKTITLAGANAPAAPTYTLTCTDALIDAFDVNVTPQFFDVEKDNWDVYAEKGVAYNILNEPDDNDWAVAFSVIVPNGTAFNASDIAITMGDTALTIGERGNWDTDKDVVLTVSGYSNSSAYNYFIRKGELTGNLVVDYAPTEAPTEAPTFTVTWKNGETVLETDENVAQGTMPEYNGTTPVKDEDDDYIYTFKGWSPEVSAVTGDVTYTAVFDSFKKYVVIIKTPKGSSYNLTVTNNTTIAQIKADLADELGIPAAQQRLIFAGEELEDTKTLVDYNIQKEDTIHDVPKSYTVTWLNDDGATIDTTTVYYGDMPEYNGVTPEKDEDGDYIYTFKGWSPEVSAVTGDVTYTAVFDSFKKYVVIIKTPKGSSYNLTVTNNTTIAQIKADLADELGIPAAQQRLIFAGEELEDTKTLVDYNIQKEDTIHDVPKSYTVTWLNDDGATIDTTTVYYGDMPEYNGTTPEKDEDDDFTYTFAGWTPEVVAVTGDVEYTATFDAVAKYEAGYYVVGTMNNWAIDPAYKLAANPAVEGEYMLNDLALTASDEIKIVYAEPGKGKKWFPDGMGNNMSFPTDGSYNIYFRPDGQGGDDWYNGLIFAKRNPPAESTAVIDLINALPTDVTLADSEQIEAARNAYDALTDDQQSFIDAETLSKLTDAEAALTEAIDQDAADAVDDKIDSLPDVVTLDDKADVEAARAAFDALTDDQKALIDNDSIAKLEAAEKVIADREAAKAVTDQINALPAASEITLADKPLVDAAVEALDNLTFEQVEYITLDTHGKLGEAIKAIMNLEAAKAVTDQINALGEVTLDDKPTVEEARRAYDALTDDQKALVTPETLEKLAAAEKAIADLEAVKVVEDMIKALPAVEDITLNDKDAVNATYDAFGALTDDQVFLLDGDLFDDLLDALDKIQDLEAAKVVEDKIKALPDVILLEDKADVEDARAAYDALEPEQKDLIDLSVVEKLEDAEEVIADREAAKAVEDQINALPDDITLADKAAVDAANEARLNLTPAQADYLTFSAIDKLFKAQDMIRDLEAAKAVEDKINALPDVILLEDKADVEDARAAYDALEPEQKDLIDLSVVEKLEDAEEVIADREAAKAVEDQINALPDDITLADKAAVDAANEARLNLTPAQADYLTFSAIDKLFKAQDMIRDLEAAKAVEDMINALPTDVTVDDEEQIEAARQAYEALTDDQKALVTPETLEKLTDAETTVDNIVLLGDVDGDGVVTITDATVIQRYLLSMGNLSDKQIKAADVDSDGEVTIIDVTLIQRYLAGVKVKFPINEYV